MAENKDVKRYRCINFGACTKADQNAVIEIPTIETLGGTPPCPCCKQQTLEEIPDKGINWKLYGMIAAAVAILCGAGFGIYKLVSPSGPTGITLDKKEIVMKVGETQVIVPTAEPEGVKATFTFKKKGKNVEVTSGGEITALKKGETTITVKCEENPEIRAICKVTVEENAIVQEEPQPEEPETPVSEEPNDEGPGKGTTTTGTTQTNSETQNGTGTKVLSYGKYVGGLKNGQPDGTGKLTFTKSYQLNAQYTAQPGEYIQGIFENGKPSFVTYYQKDGTVTKIKLR